MLNAVPRVPQDENTQVLMNFHIFRLVEPQKNRKHSRARESHPDRRRVFILTVLGGFQWRGFALRGTVACLHPAVSFSGGGTDDGWTEVCGPFDGSKAIRAAS